MVIPYIICLLAVPFNGIVVRYRASYHPKALVEDGTVPEPPTFISMAKRVWRLQGVEGLSKGLMPTFMFMTLFSILSPFPKFYLSASAPTSQWSTTCFTYTFFYIFFIVTTYRAIVTPRSLDTLNAREALHIIFSAHERKKPWAIYRIPGLLPALLINLSINIFLLRPLRDFVYPSWLNPSPLEQFIRSTLLVLVVLLGTAIAAPLEVIVTRLALQRNYGGPTFVDGPVPALVVEATPAAAPTVVEPVPEVQPLVAIATADVTEVVSEKDVYPEEKPVETPTATPMQPVTAAPVNYAVDLERGILAVGSDDVVVHVRSENDPYLGIIDCGKKIIAEEGWAVLYRMWFLTFLGLFV